MVMEVPDPSKPETHKRVDSSKLGTITYHLVPQSSEDYWVSIPQKLSHTDKKQSESFTQWKYVWLPDKFSKHNLFKATWFTWKSRWFNGEIGYRWWIMACQGCPGTNSALKQTAWLKNVNWGMKVTHIGMIVIFKELWTLQTDSTWMMTSIPCKKRLDC